MLHSLRQALKTLSVEPPAYLSFTLSQLPEYISKSGYKWEAKDADGTVTYIGILDRGFGRSFKIEWNPATTDLTFSDAKSFELLGVSSKRNAVSKVSGFKGPLAGEITKAITDSMR